MKSRKSAAGGKEHNTVIFYHANCADGFGAAWAAWHKFGDKAEYVPYRYGHEIATDCDQKIIYTLDICFHEPVLTEMKNKAKSFIAIDHHISASERIKKLPGSLFNISHSGSVLTWQYFNPIEPVPKLLSYIEDNDLWLFKLPFAEEITCALSLSDFNFGEWSQIARDFENEKKFAEYVAMGTLILRKSAKEAGEICDDFYFVEFEGRKVPTANSSLHVSNIGHKLSEKHGGLAIIWCRRKNEINVSLRSDGTVDVSAIATKYGGGGHKGAAGFSIPLDGGDSTLDIYQRARLDDLLQKLLK